MWASTCGRIPKLSLETRPLSDTWRVVQWMLAYLLHMSQLTFCTGCSDQHREVATPNEVCKHTRSTQDVQSGTDVVYDWDEGAGTLWTTLFSWGIKYDEFRDMYRDQILRLEVWGGRWIHKWNTRYTPYKHKGHYHDWNRSDPCQ